VLREEADEQKRAVTAYLLAYAPTQEQAVERLVPSIRDSSGPVRNGVLRVLLANQDKADHPRVAVAVDALSLPETMDRNKALYLLEALLRSDEARGAEGSAGSRRGGQSGGEHLPRTTPSPAIRSRRCSSSTTSDSQLNPPDLVYRQVKLDEVVKLFMHKPSRGHCALPDEIGPRIL
jgi:hypothetical protein